MARGAQTGSGADLSQTGSLPKNTQRRSFALPPPVLCVSARIRDRHRHASHVASVCGSGGTLRSERPPSERPNYHGWDEFGEQQSPVTEVRRAGEDVDTTEHAENFVRKTAGA